MLDHSAIGVSIVKAAPGSIGPGRLGFPTFWLSATGRAPGAAQAGS